MISHISFNFDDTLDILCNVIQSTIRIITAFSALILSATLTYHFSAIDPQFCRDILYITL